MARTRYRIFDNNYPHFLTCSIVGWLAVFTRPAAVEIIFDSWRFLTANNRLTIFGYVIMENHLHLIASAKRSARKSETSNRTPPARSLIISKRAATA